MLYRLVLLIWIIISLYMYINVITILTARNASNGFQFQLVNYWCSYCEGFLFIVISIDQLIIYSVWKKHIAIVLNYKFSYCMFFPFSVSLFYVYVGCQGKVLLYNTCTPNVKVVVGFYVSNYIICVFIFVSFSRVFCYRFNG